MGRKFLLFAFILLFFGNSFGQAWVAQQSDFPFNRGIHDIDIVTDDIVWCAATNETGSGSTSIKDYYKTINGGSLWTKFTIPPTGLTGLTIANIQAFDANNAFVLMNPSTLGGKLLKTSDGGANWTTITGAAFSASESFANMVYAFDNNTIVTMGDPRGGYFEIYRTTNGGTDWARVPQSNITNPTANEFGLVGSFTGYGENHFWFGSSDNRVYVSNDKGLNYTAHSVGAPAGAFISNLAFSDTLNGFCTASDGAAIDYGVYKTTDGGKTWSLFINAGDPLGKITKVASIAYEPCSMAWWVSGASTGSFGSAYSTDGGANWITVDSLRVQNIIKFGTNVGYSGNYILAGSGNTGFLKWSCTSTGVDLSQNEAISKGYPNPVQNNYRYESPYLKHSNVVLTIFDMTGRTIESKSFDNFSGYMIENFDFTNKASGLYLLNISINGKQYTQKIVKQ
ncbi:MAG: T9SS type A sorting domain-containing protein [Bacteroidetes bacterium]|nr:T9SS type A sorting domain-containing protein [Bacteroidota bacterium]